ncbi:hypothetical protein MP638_002706 [Amoeboaphelidium occidentale]|nr:hypothetical protein MP638_002706 [Amoeboaphelidium occidentale]
MEVTNGCKQCCFRCRIVGMESERSEILHCVICQSEVNRCGTKLSCSRT